MAIETRTSRLYDPSSGTREIKTLDYTVNAADYPSADAALQHLKSFDYSIGARAILQLPPGITTFQSSALLNDITVQGVTLLSLTMTSVQSTSGSAGAWTVVINVAESVAGVSVGDYLGLGPMSGGTRPLLLSGTFIVTAVDTVNKRLTFILTSVYVAGPPGGLVTGVVLVFKSRISIPTIYHRVTIRDVGVASPSIFENGALVSETSCAYYGTATVTYGGYLVANYCFFGDGGININYGTSCNIDGAILGNTGSTGLGALILAAQNASVSAWDTILSGNDIGAKAVTNSDIDLRNANVAYNTIGVKASHQSLIAAFGCTFVGNTTDKSPATFDTVGNVGSYVSDTDPFA